VNPRTKSLICLAVLGVALINFLVYFVVAIHLGGDAVNGGMRNGHYYLMSHGRYTEVSEPVFNYSRWHTYALWITHPLGLAAAWIYSRMRRARRL
jgi:hypothetical protein